MLRSSLMPESRKQPARKPRGRHNRRPPQERRPLAHGQRFRQLLTANWQPQDPATAASINWIAGRLNNIPLPDGTELLVDQPSGNAVTVRWENYGTQHCIRLDIRLDQMEADYEYSMACEEQDELRPFPAKPLGSEMMEQIGLDLREQRYWTWLSARIQATGRYLPE